MKPSSALLKNGRPFYIPDFSDNIHFECELVVRIAKNGKHVQPKFAKDYYHEIGLGLDLTARDIQQSLKEKGLPWELAKAFDGSAVVGKMVEIGNRSIQDLQFTLLKNGEVVQKGNTSLMIYSVDELISFISSRISLQKGDLLFTGTPAGVGAIAIGDMYNGLLEDEQLLEMEVK